MKKLGMSDMRITTFKIMCLFIQKSVEAGLNLGEIGSMVTAQENNLSTPENSPKESELFHSQTSNLKKLIKEAKERYPENEEAFLENLEQTLSIYISLNTKRF